LFVYDLFTFGSLSSPTYDMGSIYVYHFHNISNYQIFIIHLSYIINLIYYYAIGFPHCELAKLYYNAQNDIY